MTSQTNVKSINTLVPDIQGVLENGAKVSPGDTERLGTSLAQIISNRLQEPLLQDPKSRSGLRMSSVGKPDRQLYYNLHRPEAAEKLDASTKLKFIYGDIIEAVLLFLAKVAGHTVELEQAEVKVNGIVGHIDAVIDGVVTDVKSANSHSFKRFEDKLDQDDPFSYIEQLSGYSTGLGGLDGAFFVADKVLGHLKLVEVDKKVMKAIDIPGRIDHLKEVLAQPEPPDRCYDAVPEGKSGNMKLPVGCSYCAHKFHCWQDANNGIGLRVFKYAAGPVFLTEVLREPSAFEATF